MRKVVLAGALGNCVHVAGVVRFLRVAEQLGYETVFLGAAVGIDEFIEAIKQHDPEIVGISYRLTPDVGEQLLLDLRRNIEESGLGRRRFVFGGTPPACESAQKLQWFERTFSGLENEDAAWAYLKGSPESCSSEKLGGTLLERLEKKWPYPLLRHHFGLPTLEETVQGVQMIAESGVLDVISIAPDQNAQESFFRPHEMNPAMDGAGGVPVRSPDDLKSIHQAAQCGNNPLIRIYSGTRDLLKWAELSAETVNNAWAAIPLCWYSALDGRSKRPVEEAIRENQSAMRWHSERGIPVEVNEAHHWALRDAHDTISVATAYLAAYNAKQNGVKNYVSQYMFNTPPAMDAWADLAKILAQVEMVETLHDSGFRSYRQIRAGLLHLSPRMSVAKGQLAASTTLALSLRPDIIHVVGFCEGDHAASPEDVIESCEIVHGVMRNCLNGMPDMSADAYVQQRKRELIQDAMLLIDAIRALDTNADALADSMSIARAIQLGILDAPHLKGNSHAAGALETRVIDGAVYAIDPSTKDRLTESQRLAALNQIVGAF
ncbi:MAG: cobalamin B12-binding domain-containing protein [Armatimonadota bacterium]|nr:cobalamin B12-binding domain-containing protein [bacterium]